ncbi:SUMF1/EgtB/PvdO family nonheme iron enzyme [Streptomyces sp. BE20]|uniref:formylglycine-generating enzyme family protein n=1 Tax=Streptomyces sp. BE20 TaxID=3002525 RepID=UPI002E788EDB|nr:SUMF1/EgtB/PvdO family nonheme iron enzyme [Streptomyces sp. BE20]MEE1825357.1 SUMF1/EgtB/PvdO family nonheme iron enzyme [Streptomyces sp. BE20]
MTTNPPGRTLVWVPVPGGVCLFGDRHRPLRVVDLEWTVTPVTSAQLGLGPNHRPLVGLPQAQAARIAADLGGRLPVSKEWEWAASGTERRPYPWGDEEPDDGRANLRDVCGRLTPVDSHPRGRTPTGLWDMAGNCWEWTASKTIGGGFVIRGGSYNSLPLYARCTFLNAAPAESASTGIGFRVVRPA